ncbi:MAG TPA: hypothetical protein VEY70_13120 [Metabacillus sp.]|nr:hypothetical protein [Metabacillus sp.]
MLQTQMEKVEEIKEFEAYGSVKLDVSTIIYVNNEIQAEKKALSEMNEYGIAHAHIQVVLNDGTVKTMKIHNWELLNAVEAVFED